MNNYSLIEKVKADQLQARKDRIMFNGVDVKSSLLTTLIGESQVDGKDPTDEELIKVVQKFLKNNDIFLMQAKDENKRKTLVLEKNILKSYLPAELSEDDIRDFLDTAVQNGDKITRAFMGKINMLAKASGKVVDNKLASLILQSYL